MTRFRPARLLVIVVLLLGQVLWSGLAVAQLYPFVNYTQRQGLNSNQVHCLVQGTDGVLWFATRSGLVSFDGQQWSNFSLEQGVMEREYSHLARSADGTLWALSKRSPFRVQYRDGDRWQSLPTPKLPFTNADACLLDVAKTDQDSPRVVMANEDGWIGVYEGGVWRRRQEPERLKGLRAYLPLGDGLVLAGDEQLFLFDPRTLELQENPFPFLPDQRILALARDEESGRIHFVGDSWIGTWDGHEFVMQARDLEIVQDQILSRTNALADGAGGLFFGGITRVYHFDPVRGLEVLDRRSGRLSGGATWFYRDGEGNFWITGLRGVSKLSSLRFASYDRSQGLFADEVSAVFKDSRGRMILGHDGGLTIMGDPLETIDFGLPESQVSRVMDLAEDSEGNIWLATDSHGLGRLGRDNEVQWYRDLPGLPERVFSVVADDEDVLWVGHGDGLSRGERGLFLPIPLVSREEAVPQYVRRVFRARDGSLYLATGWDGVLHLDGWDVEQWLNPGHQMGNSTYNLLELADGRFWVGSSLGLFSLQEDGTLAPTSFPDPVITRPVYAMITGPDQHIWFGTDQGVFIWDGRELRNLALEDGLIGSEINRDGFQIDDLGQLWVATDRGVSVYRRDLDLPRRAAPRLEILGFDADGVWHEGGQPLDLNSPPRTLTVRFRGVSFTDEQHMGFRTWLENYEPDWSELSSRPISQVRYTNLPAGQYYFHVQVVNGDGSRSPAVVSQPIQIAPPLWGRWYVMLLAILLVAVLGYAGISFWEGRRYASRLENEVRESTRELRAESQRLAATLGSILDGVLALDRSHCIVLSNPAAEAILNLTHQELKGRSVLDVLPLQEGLDQDGDQPAAGWNGCLRLNGLGGETAHLEVTWSPISDEEGRRVGSVVAISDITDKLRVEREQIRSQKLESLGVLAGGIAHDFNNLLTIMLGNIDLLDDLQTLGEPDRESLELARQASFRAQTLTEQLLTFARGGAPRRQLQSLGEIIRQSVALSFSGQGHSCQVVVPDDLWPVLVDGGQMSQVFNNILINAAQAMPDGGEVEVLARNLTHPPAFLDSGDWVQVDVRDRGLGIPEKDLSHIFDPYFTTKSSGSGLGLATSYSIVTRHGGKLLVESTENVGSTFSVFLPRGDGDEVVHAREVGVSVPTGGRVLVLEDEPGIRRLLMKYLKDMGLQGVFTVDGVETVALYRAALEADEPFDVVLTDLTIPGGMGGRKTVARLREIDPLVRAVVISGYSHEEVLARYREYGFLAALGKPFTREELSRVLGGVLSRES